MILEMKTQNNFTYEGKPVSVYSIRNQNGMYAEITNFGAKIMSLFVPDRNGKLDDVVLGFDSVDQYFTKEPYFGAICGRFANRIKGASFEIDGIKYNLNQNDRGNHLHGGFKGFESRVWDCISSTDDSLSLQYISPDNEEGYPGNLTVIVTYQITEENELKIHFEAKTDKPTIVNLCNHSYFNLTGSDNDTIYDHLLTVNADFYTPKDDTDTLTGEIKKVENTALDFRQSTPISERINDPEFEMGRGIDNNWVVMHKEENKLAFAASILEKKSGRKMEVYTTMPGIQIYTGNWIEDQIGKNNNKYGIHSGICLETQGFPNSPNIAHFPTAIVRPDQKQDEWCIYKFSIDK
jgi:aldose 1-epimerase